MGTRAAFLVWIAGALVAGCGGSCDGERDRPDQPPAASTDQRQDGGASSAVAFDFPEDHRLHRGSDAESPHRIEWLRFSGALERQGTGQRVEYAVGLTQRWSEERSRFEYTYDVEIIDPAAGDAVRESFELLGAPRMRSDRGSGEPIWTFTQGAMRVWHKEQKDVWEIRVNNGKGGNQLVEGWLTLTNQSRGYQPAADDDPACRRYVHPGLVTWGNLTFGGESVSLSGESRLEHYFGEAGEPAPSQTPSSPSAVEHDR